MIRLGNTIVFRREWGEVSFYWLCIIEDDEYVFFDWYGNPRNATPTDYWRLRKSWLEEKVKEGIVEVYDCFPLEKYGDVFERQAVDFWRESEALNGHV